MEYRRLGKSGLKVSTLSLGSWLTFGKQIGDDVAEKLMITAYDAGVNFFDNAEIYARGKSELVMGKILKKTEWPRDTFIVSSKAFFGAGGKLPNQTGLSRKHLFEACHAALNRLQVDYLDLFYCHRPDPETPIEETVFAMNDLIRQGKVLYWGTSEWSAQEIMQAFAIAKENHLIGPTMEQPQYNMFHRRRPEFEYERLYTEMGLGTTIWSPLSSGLLSGKYSTGEAGPTRLTIEGMEWLKERTLDDTSQVGKVIELMNIAKELKMSMPQLAIAWCIKHSFVSTAILGASKVEQLEENLKTLDHMEKITDQVMEKIELVLKNKPMKEGF